MAAARKAGNYEIPFDKAGNQLHYPDHNVHEWRANEEFEDTLTYAGYGRGRSAAFFCFKRANGKIVNVFMRDFEDMVPNMTMGQITGRFRFVKRGQNYGCVLVQFLAPKT